MFPCCMRPPVPLRGSRPDVRPMMAAMEVLFDTLLITQDSESVLFYAVAGLYNLSNDASFAQMAGRKPGVLAKLHSLNESANPDTVKYATGTIDNWRKHHQGPWPPQQWALSRAAPRSRRG